MSIVQVAVMAAPAVLVFPLLGATLRSAQPPPLALQIGLAIGLGLGIASCVYGVALLLFDGTWASVVALDGAMVVVSAAAWWAYRVPAPPARALAQRWSRLDVGLAVACTVAAAAFVGLFAAEVYARPHGEMDAWMTWDVKARFLAQGGDRWRLPFEDTFGHPDYPLLLPAAVAHAWRYVGDTDQALPIGVAGLFALATVTLLLGGLSALRGRTVGLLGALCLLGTPGFARRAAWLYADGPLAFYALASVVLAADWERVAPRRAVLVWAGLAVGLAASTKREGLFLLGAFAAARIGSSTGDERRRSESGWIALGAAAPLALMVYFHLQSIGRDPLSGRLAGAVLERLSDPGRCVAIAAELWRLLVGSPSHWLALALPAFVLLVGRTAKAADRAAARHAALFVGLLATAYFANYLTTPQALDWLLPISFDRLLFHLWPSALFALFLWTASPQERGWGDCRPPFEKGGQGGFV